MAPKLQTGLLKPGGLGSSGSSILNLPVLAQDTQLQTTARGMKGIDSSKQLFNSGAGGNNREESKISGTVSSYEAQNGKSPSYYSRGPNTNVPLSPSSQKDAGQVLVGQGSRNMSVLNMKKSSARFLNPINGVEPKQMPHTNIDKYPKPDSNPLNMPPPRSGVREAKNHQLFEKYMNRHGRKGSIEMPGGAPGGAAGAEGGGYGAMGNEYSNDFALPSLGKPGPVAASNATSQLSGRN